MDSPTTQKKVRFVLQDTQYTYEREPSVSPPSGDDQEAEEGTPNSHSPPTWVLSTPSPTHSVSTVDTDGPMTPPSAGPSTLYHPFEIKEPSSRRGSPPEHDGRVWLHPLIVNTAQPWDVADRPTGDVLPDLGVYGSESCIISNTSRAPYFNLVHPCLAAWPLRVDLRTRDPLTLDGLFTMIYNYLNEPFPSVDLSQSSRGHAIYQAFAARCKARKVDPGQDAIRRVDYTFGRRIFYGLREVEEDPMSWELVLLPEAVS